jgi:MtfA peptidase
MWSRLRAAWRARRDQAAVARRPIPDVLWRRTLKRFPFLPRAGHPDEALLRRLCSLFLDRKEFSGAHGLTVTDDMAVAIAAQACLPVLRLGLAAYDGFVGIVVHPGQAKVRREHVDDSGIVHAYDEVLSGEAVQGGPVMLSWRDVRASGASADVGYNVVIHEFAHVLDMADAVADGVPLLPAPIARAEWQRTLKDEYDGFCRRVDTDVPTALDPYGAESIDEFFAVATESFFVAPVAMREEHRALYTLFTRYYGQDPAAPN